MCQRTSELEYQEQAVLNPRKSWNTGAFLLRMVGLGKTYIATLLAANWMTGHW
jgi:hypothetical protein